MKNIIAKIFPKNIDNVLVKRREEYCFRALPGIIKPLVLEEGAGTPPGGYLDKIMIPLALVMLILCLMTKKSKVSK